jgi:hypothetical protein
MSGSKWRPLNSSGRFRLMQAKAYQTRRMPVANTCAKTNGLGSGWPYPGRLFSITGARFGLSQPAVLILSPAFR